MAKYQKYAEYKDSGVEWLGEIPSHWEMWKLAHAYSEIGSGTTPSTTNEENFEGDIPWVTTGELRENTIFDTKKKVSKKTLELYPTLKKYPVGSVAIAMYGATIGRLGIFGVEATTNQACCVMTISKVLNNDYLFYWLQAFKDEIVQLSSGGGQPNINQEKVASLRISAPNVKDQTQIANFLDHETAKIDHLIEKQQQLIELLKEKRQAVISHAVTKGLNPNVPMKDSGVEWLGKVPEHWEVTRFAYQIFYQEGPGILAVDFHETGIPLLRIQNVKSDFVSNDYKTYLSPSKVLSKWDHYRVEKGDLIISCSASTGLVSEVDESTVGAIPYTGLIRLKPRTRKIISQYIKLLVQSDLFFEQIEVLQTGSTIQHFGPFHLQQMYISLPPNEEQEVICLEVKNRVRDIENLILKAESAIQLIQERRTALISAAVTGKIDVRHWQAPTVAEAQTELSA
ncbi:restriction endonuclease subunit S [Acinetobacter towneri]|uniref:restriction endonuclease subunit S n=1 Tax=Acinetobacter towneri TaxID=202956 RepID=UPI0034D5565C